MVSLPSTSRAFSVAQVLKINTCYMRTTREVYISAAGGVLVQGCPTAAEVDANAGKLTLLQRTIREEMDYIYAGALKLLDYRHASS
jgi:hypothetical protein